MGKKKDVRSCIEQGTEMEMRATDLWGCFGQMGKLLGVLSLLQELLQKNKQTLFEEKETSS